MIYIYIEREIERNREREREREREIRQGSRKIEISPGGMIIPQLSLESNLIKKSALGDKYVIL